MFFPKMTLYHYWRSSCSWRVRWALAVKGLSYESVAINLLEGEQREELYLKKNLSGFVPCLQIGDEFVSESFAILEWLEESCPNPALIPKDSMARLRMREFCLKIVSGIQPIQNLAVMRFHSQEKEKQKKWSKHWIEKGLFACENLVSNRGENFCFGENLSFADLCLVPQVYNAKRFDVSMELFPKLNKLYEKALRTETCQEAHPDKFS